MRRGFTILELLVASLLLGMLMTILTMIFNQSSIAWRTGTAGVVQMNDTRRAMGTFQDIRDEMLPWVDGQKDQYRTVSLWENGTLRKGQRAYDTIKWGKAPQFTLDDAERAVTLNAGNVSQGQNSGLFTVGVKSAGPDGVFDTEDDITTWPDEVE